MCALCCNGNKFNSSALLCMSCNIYYFRIIISPYKWLPWTAVGAMMSAMMLSPLDLWTKPVAVTELLTQWSDRKAAEQTTKQSDHLHATGCGGYTTATTWVSW